MKNLLLILFVLAVGFQAQAENYQLNEVSLDAAFDQSIDLTQKIGVMDITSIAMEFGISQAAEEGNKQKTAAIVGIITLITGVGILIPIHRFILGTDGKGLLICAVYCGAGVLGGWSWWMTLADVIFIFMDDTHSAYINNSKILMWTDNI